MTKVVLNDITSGYASVAAINANNALVETAFDNTLSRDGSTPNHMLVDLDMNGHRILNELAQSGTGFIWQGTWTTGLSYALNNLVANEGSSYICLVAHTAGANFATDLAALKWQIVALKSDPVPGSGDMLIANNLSELTATKTTARGNISAAASGVNNDIIQFTGITTPLSVAQGGTGAVTHTANSVLIGAGTSAVTSVAPSTSGNVLTSTGSAWASSPLASKVIYTTRDVSVAGTQDITGFGFDPKSLSIVAAVTGTASGSWGHVDSAGTQACVQQIPGGALYPQDTVAVQYNDGAGNIMAGTVSFISDGIRITWGKTNTPTGTFTLVIHGTR